MRAKKQREYRSAIVASGSPREVKAPGDGTQARQHQDVVPSRGQGPQGTVGVMIPFGDAPPCPPPPVGAGAGFKGWR